MDFNQFDPNSQGYLALQRSTEQLSSWTGITYAGLNTVSAVFNIINTGNAKETARINQGTALVNHETAAIYLQKSLVDLENSTKQIEAQERIAKLQRDLMAFQTIYSQLKEDERLVKRFEHDRMMADFQRETQVLMAWVHLEVAKAQADDAEERAAYPLKTPASTLLKEYEGYFRAGDRIPPMVILVPAVLRHDQDPKIPSNVVGGFAQVGEIVNRSLRSALDAYKRANRPVNYAGIDWKTASKSLESSIRALNDRLKPIPTILIETRWEGDLLTHHIGWWDKMGKYQYEDVFEIAWKDVVYPIARECAREWCRVKAREIDSFYQENATPGQENSFLERERLASKLNEHLDKLEKHEENRDEAVNLRKLEQEEKNQRHGLRQDHDYKYVVNDEKHVRELANFLSVCHVLMAGMAIDRYYLINHNESPILPASLLPDLVQKVPHDDLKLVLTDAVSSFYRRCV